MNKSILPSKLVSIHDACRARVALAHAGKRVVLTNGCFDVLHPGHIFSLEQAHTFGDSLWVALNSDDSVKHLKGPDRPIFTENMRAYMLSALSVVDGIFIFQNPRLTNEILQFAPDVYVKSGDYTMETLDRDERHALETIAAEIHFIPYLAGYSTTQIIQRIHDKK